ncbi:ThuA domain-containing protein [candidate division KSB1 bacterium]|nr:ThuA domain-containing protein [candidate division KSB1 bacterium]
MRIQCTLWLFISVVLLIGAAIAPAAQKIKILIITGGHDFEREQFFAMFSSMADIEFTSVEHPAANDIYATSAAAYDALVYYDMNQEISEEQKKAFLSVVEKGKGLVFLHHSLASYQTWDDYMQIQGGRYNENPQDAAKKSTYKHDVELNVYILDREHPVTQGVSDFKIYDEVYGNFNVLPGVHPLLKTDHPESGEIIGWAHEYGAAKIVYLQSGHDHHAYENENYRALVRQAIQWVAAR